jgi:tRNA 2-thiouridine synthesizing protein A
VDARGLLCPLPLLRLERALRGKEPGTIAVLLATDPAAEGDIRTFCLEGGHAFLAVERDGVLLRLRVRKA